MKRGDKPFTIIWMRTFRGSRRWAGWTRPAKACCCLTNDSKWAARILAPETHLQKTYHVQIAALAGDALLDALRRGVRKAGDLLRVARASLLRQGERNSWLEIVLEEGKNRHIRRMLKALDVDVLRLV